MGFNETPTTANKIKETRIILNYKVNTQFSWMNFKGDMSKLNLTFYKISETNTNSQISKVKKTDFYISGITFVETDYV